MDRINAYRASRQIAHQSSNRTVALAGAADAGRPPTLSGYCKLDKGRPVTLKAREASVLRITRGRVWLTANPALNQPGARLGDHFPGRGESVMLAAGEAVVMESYGPGDASSAYYSWEAAAQRGAMASLAFPGWRAGVLGPLLDLRLALGLAAAALGRLARGLAVGGVAGVTGVSNSLATFFIAERGHEYWTKQVFKPKSGDACPDCGGH
ncbi:MAG: DUF2917 domain-containing protein [Polaromonas sp.]